MKPHTDGHGDEELPSRFAEALQAVRHAIAGWESARIPPDTILAALMTEMVPRLVEAYGATGVSAVLADLAAELAEAPAARH